MGKILRLPYLLPNPERIEVVRWILVKGDTPEPLPKRLPDWDPAASIQIQIEISVDAQGIASDCSLHPDAELRLSGGWESSGTGLRRREKHVDLDLRHSRRSHILDMTIPGTLLDGSVSIHAELSLSSFSERAARISPWMAGSRLWQESQKIALRGEGARFPVDVVDFESSFTWLPPHAGWYLDWDRSSFDRPVLNSIRLHINSRHERVKRAVSQSLEDDEPIRETISFDVAKSMITAALESEEFVENLGAYDEDTVGISIQRHLSALFPDFEYVEDIRDMYRQYPDRFNTLLQDRLKLFWEKF